MFKRLSTHLKNIPLAIAALALLSSLSFGLAADAVGASTATSTNPPPTNGTVLTNTQIITKGDSEIARRLTTLNKLDSAISASTKISAADQATLTTEVNNEISGLTTDKTTLDATTTVAAARAAAQSIFTEYRVYALVVPQVYMIRAADRQQLIETKLSTLATGISTALGTSSTNTTATTDLATMKADITSATSISSSVETSVIGLSPSNYDSDHTLLLQYYTQLNTAKTDIQNATTLAKTIINTIK